AGACGGRAGAGPAGRAAHFRTWLLRGVARLLGVGRARRVDLRVARPVVARHLMNGEHGQRRIPDRRLFDRPVKCALRVVRAINANRDSRHYLLLLRGPPPSGVALKCRRSNSGRDSDPAPGPTWVRPQWGPSGRPVILIQWWVSGTRGGHPWKELSRSRLGPTPPAPMGQLAR